MSGLPGGHRWSASIQVAYARNSWTRLPSSGLHRTGEVKNGSQGLMVAQARIGPFAIDDAMVFELDSEGRIKLMRPHLRPWLATTWFAIAVGAKVARHPGVIWRALRSD
jgi:hypothetical protein